MHDGGDRLARRALRAGSGDDGEAGADFVRAAAEQREHAACVGCVCRFAEDLFFRHDDGVCGDHDGILICAAQMRCGFFGFGGCDAGNVSVREFVRVARFVNVGHEDGELDARIAQDFSAAGEEAEARSMSRKAFLDNHRFLILAERAAQRV